MEEQRHVEFRSGKVMRRGRFLFDDAGSDNTFDVAKNLLKNYP